MALSKTIIFLIGRGFLKKIVEFDAELWLKVGLEIGLKVGLIIINRKLAVNIWSLLLMTILTPKKIGIIPPSRIVSFRVWIAIRSSKYCIHIVR